MYKRLKLQSRWFKNYIFAKKVYFDQPFDIPMLLYLFNHTLLLCHILLFGRWIFSIPPGRVSNSLDPDQARHFVRPDLGSNCLQKLSAGKELNAKLVDTTFWLKPWLKLISFGYNFFFWLKCWLQQILSQGNSAD